jgi:uncharacterized phage infection (PIP) family protein YhgE
LTKPPPDPTPDLAATIDTGLDQLAGSFEEIESRLTQLALQSASHSRETAELRAQIETIQETLESIVQQLDLLVRTSEHRTVA